MGRSRNGFQLRVKRNCIQFRLSEVIGARNGMTVPATRWQDAGEQVAVVGFHVRVAEILTQREGIIEAMFKCISDVADFLL